jgi:hypothetical protein
VADITSSVPAGSADGEAGSADRVSSGPFGPTRRTNLQG